MANKNDNSDLVHFSIVSLIIIVGIFALAKFGYSLIDKNYIRQLNAKVSEYDNYIRRQWDASKIEIKTLR